MPNKTSRKKVAAPELPSIPKELVEPFVSGSMTAEAVNAAHVIGERDDPAAGDVFPYDDARAEPVQFVGS